MELNSTLTPSAFDYVAPTLDLAKDASTINRALVAVLVVFMMSIGLYSSTRKRGPDLSHIPVLLKGLSAAKQRNEYRNNAKCVLQQGYEQYNKAGKPFQLQTSDGTMVVLNARQNDEVCSMPDRVVDSQEPRARILEKDYTHYKESDAVVIRTIKTHLSTRLHWSTIPVYDHILPIVAAASTRIFVGEELAANEEWLSCAIDYTVQMMTVAMTLKRMPSLLLPMIYRFLPAYQKLGRIRKASIRLLKPIVQARREAMETPDGQEGADNMLQWTLNERVKKQFHDKDYELLAHFQLELALAATHTTSMALTQILFDLVAWPEYIDILRQEVKEQYAANNFSFKGQFMKGLSKLDSFMRESQRWSPPSYTTTGRDVRHDITLSDGTFLPKDTMVVANAYQINHDAETPHGDTPPNVFDGLRYHNMRDRLIRSGATEKEAGGKYQFVSLTDGSSAFGNGRHACPGRFFAANEIKLLVAKFLMEFDFKMPPGESGRYENDSYERMVFPNSDKTILIKRL
ncbi:hypothetical protein PRZ48_004483 [Zasmidium cellare]|uniref:Cytochrome P450 n=1 Tax=Zasmidium cellare TaxID=395010 RepID=A0ABR0EQU7_ZASCE|nr:hypothetical protein PRZ48_004483 [Zasmidium cellare]